uniref:Glucuronosyltransferase n=1 Tax=Rhabditophanes sp. KR3021 TaxID=114890 RepID=A0AC35UEX5_9BILA
MKQILLLLLFFISVVYPYKIAVFTPVISPSQYIWNGRVASKLAGAGNDVTLIALKYFGLPIKQPKISPLVKIVEVEGASDFDWEGAQEINNQAMFEDLSFFDGRMKIMMNSTVNQMIIACGNFLQDKPFLKWLENEKFDLAITHMYEYCPIGLIHHAKIPTWIWMNSGALMDYIAYDIGLPLPSSYVSPGVMESDDQMTLFERTKSFIGHTITPYVYHEYMITSKETELFRKYISPDFPDLRDLGKACPLVMANTNELYDVPKPTLHKVVYIGGLGMSKKDSKPLEGIFKKVAEDPKVKGIILLSFGSVANASFIPVEWKSAFMDAFASFPDYHFFFRYVGDDLKKNHPKNVDVTDWLPQSDLLQHPKTKLIITHGGYNSIQESIQASKPMIMVALFGDQPKNAVIAQRNGLGIYLKKAQISKQNIMNAISKILHDNTYEKRMQLLQKMIEKQPFTPDEKLVKYTNYLAEFKSLDNLVPYGTKLNFIQYYQIDVVIILVSIILGVLFLIYKLLKLLLCLVVRWCCKSKCSKKAVSKDKKNE